MAYADPPTQIPGQIAASALWNTYVRDNFTALGRDPEGIRHVGTTPFEIWYPAVMYDETSFTTAAITGDTLYAWPWVSPRGGTLDRIAFENTATNAGAVRLGIYAATSATNIYPGARVLESEFAAVMGTASAHANTISTVLTPSTLYWVVLLGSTTPTLRFVASTAMRNVLGLPSTLGATPRSALSPAQTYGALPSTFPAGATPQTIGVPLVAVRYSA